MRFSDSDKHDPLTGVATEAALCRYVAAALEGCDRGSPPVCFLQIDIDGLAGIHDESGAAVRDAVLLGVADCLREGIRGLDLLGRSADGFGICMPELTAAQARGAAQRLRFRILANPVATGRGSGQRHLQHRLRPVQRPGGRAPPFSSNARGKRGRRRSARAGTG